MPSSVDLSRHWDVARVAGRFLARCGHDRWSADELRSHQQRRLLKTVAHAAVHSRFYRQLYDGIRIDHDLDISSLPVVTKRDVMERFDDMVTDGRLRLADIEGYLQHASADQDDMYLGEYRVLATSGTSGLRGFFVFSRAEWRVELANVLRWFRFIGVRPTAGRRLGISIVGAPSAIHVSRRLPLSGDLGLFRLQNLAVTENLADIAADLRGFQPDILLAYPTMARLLAAEQLAGRLGIAPRIVSTHSELLTPDTRRLISSAWGVAPFDHYGLTEVATVAVECDRHRGLHLLNDDFIAEIVDEQHQPVAPGEVGGRLLLTSLVRTVQPLIRYEVSDRLRLGAFPCPCGRPFPLLTAMEGRDEECLSLQGIHGRVSVPPLALSATLEGVTGVAEFKASWDGTRLHISVVLADGAEQVSVETMVRTRLEAVLSRMGAVIPEIAISFVDRLSRKTERMGKHRIVETNV